MQESLQFLQTQSKTELIETFRDYVRINDLPESKLLDAMHYALLNGGKRMRPLLANIVGTMLNAQNQDINAVSLAIECIHAYSLVHDDLPAMDDDALRRGEPTCHIKFDEATAILAGDALQTSAFEVLATLPMSDFASGKRVEMVRELSQASGAKGMCLGQSLDLIATNETIDFDALTTLHQLKTGALLACAVRMGAMISPITTEEDLLTLSTFAAHIGIAFQIQDDILDVTTDTATLGKQQGSDEANNKSTFVTQLGLDGARKALNEHHHQAKQALTSLPYDTHLLEMFSDYMITRTF
ncbi:polyprenyl synthetase family protein [Glaciecola sp. XM2]|jgi:farnesyl diphosphate synthase|nr:polyprenyl synthetase family protein [Glaciecola sp. XM2]